MGERRHEQGVLPDVAVAAGIAVLVHVGVDDHGGVAVDLVLEDIAGRLIAPQDGVLDPGRAAGRVESAALAVIAGIGGVVAGDGAVDRKSVV